jgi:hypothetical protein
MPPPAAGRRDGYIPPCIPTRAVKPPSGAGWVHEIKHDGYRLQVRRVGDQVRLFTRRGYDWTGRYPAIGVTAKIFWASLVVWIIALLVSHRSKESGGGRVFDRIFWIGLISIITIGVLASGEHCEGSLAAYLHLGHLEKCTGP